MTCPLCESADHSLFHKDKTRSFYSCHSCGLIFVPRDLLVSADQEKNRYEAHENSDDEGYRSYLGSIAANIIPHIRPRESGLDFGCGKTTILAGLLSPAVVSSYDIFFHPDQSLLRKPYDFIVMSEVIEHLRDLGTMKELRQLSGKFFIKTKLAPDTEENFANWFYKRDITHIQFFNEQSFGKLSELLGLGTAEKIGDDLYLFRNN